MCIRDRARTARPARRGWLSLEGAARVLCLAALLKGPDLVSGWDAVGEIREIGDVRNEKFLRNLHLRYRISLRSEAFGLPRSTLLCSHNGKSMKCL